MNLNNQNVNWIPPAEMMAISSYSLLPLEFQRKSLDQSFLSVSVIHMVNTVEVKIHSSMNKATARGILKQSPSFIYNILNCNVKFITSGQFVQ